MEILGIDIGFGFTKATMGEKSIIFKSLLGDATVIQFTDSTLEGQGREEHLQIEVDGNAYFLGELAERQSVERYFTLDQTQFVERFAKNLAIAAAARLVNSHIPINLVTGLPIGYYREYKEALAKILVGEHKVVMTGADGQTEKKVVNVNRVRIIPQPWGSLFNLMLNDIGEIRDKRLIKEKIGVVDVGFRTSDYSVSDKMRYSERGSRTTESGIARAFNVIATKLREKSGVNVELYRLYDAVHEGSIKIRGEEYDLKTLTKHVFSQLATSVANEIDRLWVDDWDIDTMIVSGGGGSVLADYLIPLLKGNVIAMDPASDARMNNVKGYWKFGRHVWAKGVISPMQDS